MISGNVQASLTAPHQSVGHATNSTGLATFASKLIKHGFNVDEVIERIAGNDPSRLKLLKVIEDDGGISSFKKLLERIIDKRPIQGQNNTDPHQALPDIDQEKNETRGGNDLPNGRKYVPKNLRSPLHSYLQPISAIEDLHQGLIPDDLTDDGRFARVGKSYPGLLVDGINPQEELVYRFKNRHSTGLENHGGSNVRRAKDVELTNCFYPISKGDNLAGSPWKENPELAKMTGAYMNACDGIGKNYYNGAFDIKINMKAPGNVTVFRLIPHHEGTQYLDSSNTLRTLPMDSSVDAYRALVDDGARFEHEGSSPLTMRVEHYGGKHYFTVKTRSDYSTYKDADNQCDIPFKGDNTQPGAATCCTDGGYQRQDVKYIYIEPLKQGWFHVAFNVEFSDYAGTTDVGSPYTAFSIDNQKGVISYGRIGNHNRDSQSEPSGYHAQFGINDASEGSVVVRIKNPQFQNAERQNPQWPNWPKTEPLQLSGECQPSGKKTSVAQSILRKLVASEG